MTIPEVPLFFLAWFGVIIVGNAIVRWWDHK